MYRGTDHISYHHIYMRCSIYIVVVVVVRLSFLVDHFIAFVLLFILLILLFWIVIPKCVGMVRPIVVCLYSVTWITIENLCSLENSVYSLIAHVFLLPNTAHTLTNRHALYMPYGIHTHNPYVFDYNHCLFNFRPVITNSTANWRSPHTTKSGSKIIDVYSTLKFCCCKKYSRFRQLLFSVSNEF